MAPIRPAPGPAQGESTQERNFLDDWEQGRVPLLQGIVRVRQFMRANSAQVEPEDKLGQGLQQ